MLERCREVDAQAVAHFDPTEAERLKQEPDDTLAAGLGRLDLLKQEAGRRTSTGEKDFSLEEAMAYFKNLRRTPSPNVAPCARQ